MNKDELINNLIKEISQCEKCNLCKSRINTVPGNGNLNAEIMVIAESPGMSEDEQGIPLVGRSGKLYNIWLKKELNINREEVYTCNILKCRPPNNRDPLPEEVSSCISFLYKQIEIIKPKIIITLGRISAQILLNDSNFRITKEHGIFKKFKDISLIPIFHPAFLLRNMTDNNKNMVKSAFLKVKNMLTKEF